MELHNARYLLRQSDEKADRAAQGKEYYPPSHSAAAFPQYFSWEEAAPSVHLSHHPETVGRGRREEGSIREGNAILGQYFPPPFRLLFLLPCSPSVSVCLDMVLARLPSSLWRKWQQAKNEICADKGCMIVYSLNCLQSPLSFMSMNGDGDSRNLSE